jgi:hypothetical protein
VVNFTIHSIDVPHLPVPAEYSEALTLTHRQARRRYAPGVIVTTDWSHVAQAGTQSTRLQAKAVWGPRVH